MKFSKQNILDACITKQQLLVDSFTEREAEINNDILGETESASQSEDRKAEKFELLQAISDELAFAQQEMAYLNTFEAEKESSIVEPGAVVITNQISFFIGISSEKVEIGNGSIFGISVKAPIYASMLGLKKGDSFKFNESAYVIEDLY